MKWGTNSVHRWQTLILSIPCITHLNSVYLALQLPLKVKELFVCQLLPSIFVEEVGQEGGAKPMIDTACSGVIPMAHPHARLVTNHFLHLLVPMVIIIRIYIENLFSANIVANYTKHSASIHSNKNKQITPTVSI